MAREQTRTKSKTKSEILFPNRYNVIVLNDDFTPMEFVIQLLVEIFNRTLEEAKNITIEIHEDGRGIAGTYSHEIAEQKTSESVMISRHNGHPLKIITEKMQ
jgi:ATP-dependent Clp protease adaptor protein ClpS